MMTDDELRKLLAEATPGPWEMERKSLGKRGSQEVEFHGAGMSWFGLASAWVRLEGSKHDAPDGLANARLIAAAPDLAAEVLRLRATLSVITATDCYSRDEVTAIARAALDGSK